MLTNNRTSHVKSINKSTGHIARNNFIKLKIIQRFVPFLGTSSGAQVRNKKNGMDKF